MIELIKYKWFRLILRIAFDLYKNKLGQKPRNAYCLAFIAALVFNQPFRKCKN